MGSLDSTRALFPADTYTVSQLGEELKELLAEAYWSVWVVGEIQRLRQSNGHLYIELVEKGGGDRVVAKLDLVLFRKDRMRVERLLRDSGQSLAEGQMMRCRGQLDWYPPFGRLQLIARDVDPVYALGVLEQRRQETLRWLEQQGLIGRNAALELPRLPLEIGLVTAPESAAYHDFVVTLEHSGLAFRVAFAPSTVQGSGAEASVLAALAALERHHRLRPLDAVVLIRGGGSRTDLAVFDAKSLATAVAGFPVPVLSGIGHQTDTAIVDRVAWRAFKTPTGVAEFLCSRAETVERELERLASRLAGEARERLRSRHERLRRAVQRVRAVDRSLGAVGRRTDRLAARLGLIVRERLRRHEEELRARERRLLPSARRVDRGRVEVERTASRLAAAARSRVTVALRDLDRLGRLAYQLSPERVLERGFSLTLDRAGRPVRSVRDVTTGAHLHTRLRDGRLRSEVTAVEAESEESKG